MGRVKFAYRPRSRKRNVLLHRHFSPHISINLIPLSLFSPCLSLNAQSLRFLTLEREKVPMWNNRVHFGKRVLEFALMDNSVDQEEDMGRKYFFNENNKKFST